MKKNRILSYVILVTFLISIIAVSPVSAATVGLVAEWDLDEGSGSVAFDSSVNNNDGVLSGGKFGNALYFDGDNDYVEIPDSLSLDNIEDLTVELWLKPSVKYQTNPLYYVLVSKFEGPPVTPSAPYSSFQFVYHKAGYLYLYVTTGIAVQSIPLTLDAGTWYHLAATFKNSDNEGQIFVNGADVTQSTSTKTMTGNDVPLCIGVRADTTTTDPPNPTHEVKGVIDEVRISNTVRYTTAFSIQTSAFVSDSNTVGLWHFDESVGPTAFDDSGNGNHGTIVGATWAGPTWVPGYSGSALRFDGVDDFVEIADDDSLDIPDGITIEAMVFPEAIGGYRTIVSKRMGSNTNYALRLWGGRVEFYCRDSLNTWTEWYTPSIITAGSWYNIVATYDFDDIGSIRIYVDGVDQPLLPVHPADPGVLQNDYPVYLGQIGGGSQRFKGIIDEVRIWNVALEAEIDVNPDTLNLKSNGEWITCYIELSDGFDVNDIDVGSIKLTVDGEEFSIDPEAPTEIGDYDSDGVPDLMVKFDRSGVIDKVGTIDFENTDGKFYDLPTTITGTADGIPFEGTDTIRVRK